MKKLAWVIVIITIGSMAAQATITLVTSGDISVAGNWSNGLPLIGNQGTIAPHGNAMLADTVSAGVIAWNFTSDWPKPTIQGETADGTDQWTDSVDEAAAPGSGTKVANSTDQYAVTTPVNAAMVTVFWESSNMWNGGAENNPDQGLYRVYLDDVGAGPMVTVFGLSAWLATVPGGATGYKLDFYRSTDLSGTTFAGLNIYDGTGTTDPLLESIAGGAVTGDGAYPTGSGSAGSRLKQSAVGTFTADTVTFNSVRGQGGGNRGCIAGFKITATTAGDPFLSFPMDSDPGWITEGDWAFGQPQGLSGDPSSGFTGANAYGYNLSGDYTNNIPQYWLT
ncbi:MAG: hypothetical protein KAU94_13160, partial [Verrucomicrobia bacterium]|nr:hypothetical protein [Verrucomicrobiota bacterium]